MVLTAAQLEAMMPDATQIESDEPEMESSLHYLQLLLLVTCLEWLWQERSDFFIGANLTIYFSRQQLRNRDFRGPDFFLVQPTQNHPRKSWVVWEEEGQYPNLIIELLSNSTATIDRTVKKELYQTRFRTPEYFWFSPETLEFNGFRLIGHEYEEILVNDRGWRWSEELGLYLGVEFEQLRYFTIDGVKVPTPQEAAQAEYERAQAEYQRAQTEYQRAQTEYQRAQAEQERADTAEFQLERERERAEKLAEQLRSLGFDPDV